MKLSRGGIEWVSSLFVGWELRPSVGAVIECSLSGTWQLKVLRGGA